MAQVRLLISDVDGTLVTRDKRVTERTLQALEKLRAAGILFSITTGRPPRGVSKLAKALGLTTPIAAFNGGALVRPDLEIIDQRPIPQEVAFEVVRHLQDSGIDVWVYRGADWYVTRPGAPHMDREAQNVGFEPTVVPDLVPVLDAAVKLVAVCDDSPLLALAETEIRQRFGAHISALRSQPYYLDITHADANKGMVVRLNSQFLRIPLDEIAVIGDGVNDVLMFGVAGISIAMANAIPEVQRAARYVTTSNEEEGFANAVDWFVLGRRPKARRNLGLPPRTRACLFDLDGVVTQTAKIHAAAWKETFDAYLRERSKGTSEPFVDFDVSDYQRYVDGKPRLDGVRSFLASRGILVSEGLVEELGRRKNERVLELLRREHVETYEGSVRYVQEVRKAGLRTAVVSSSRNCEEVLESAGIADLFDARIDGVVAAREHLAGKPAPDTFLAGAKELGVEPSEAAVFEDALAGVEAGRAGHFGYVVGVYRTGDATELRSHGADTVVPDLSVLLEPP